MHAVPREAVLLQQARGRERGGRQVNPRGKQRHDRGVTGDFFQRAHDSEGGLPELDRDMCVVIATRVTAMIVIMVVALFFLLAEQ